jgi:hypothetical protein
MGPMAMLRSSNTGWPAAGEETAQTAFAAFTENGADEGGPQPRFEDDHLGANRDVAFHEETFAKHCDFLLAHFAAHAGDVGVLKTHIGIREAVHQRAVVGEQYRAFNFAVEPSGRKKPCIHALHKIDNRVPAFFVFGGTDDAARFVEQDVHPCFGGNRLAVEAHLIDARLDFRPGFNDGAVHANAARRDKGFALAAGSVPALGEVFLKVYGHWFVLL